MTILRFIDLLGEITEDTDYTLRNMIIRLVTKGMFISPTICGRNAITPDSCTITGNIVTVYYQPPIGYDVDDVIYDIPVVVLTYINEDMILDISTIYIYSIGVPPVGIMAITTDEFDSCKVS